MNSLEETITGKNTLYTDYRAEFIASCLIESGYDSEEVRIIREGLSKGGKNVDKIVWENSEDKFSKFLTIYAKKRDLYESLPEGLFHRRMDLDDKKNHRAVIDYIKHERQVALSASLFFKPFEISLDKILVEAYQYEMRLEKRDKHDDFIRLFDSVCPLLRMIPLDKSLFAVSVLTQLYRFTTTEQIAEILSVFLDCKVDIELCYSSLTINTEQCEWKLGEERLSVSTVLGGEITDFFPVMNIRIESLPPQYRDLLFEDSEAYRRLLEIMELFVPSDTEINININVAKEGIEFLLTEDEDSPRLGYSTILS